MIWTAKALANLAILVTRDISFAQIGKILGVSKNAVIGKTHRLKLKKAKTTHIEYKRHEKPNMPIPPTPPVFVAVPKMVLLPMLDLKDWHCRYPFDGEEETVFCGRQKNEDTPYCQKHADICYAKKPPLRPRSEQRF